MSKLKAYLYTNSNQNSKRKIQLSSRGLIASKEIKEDVGERRLRRESKEPSEDKSRNKRDIFHKEMEKHLHGRGKSSYIARKSLINNSLGTYLDLYSEIIMNKL